jgi:AcrR family transcriptional regulator
MIIPVPGLESPPAPACEWTALAADAKRERLLEAAAEVFVRQGLEAPMSEVAEAAGAGVASVYRRFPSKRDLLAALVVRRLEQTEQAARDACRSEGDRWSALTRMVRTLVERQSADNFLGTALRAVADHPQVVAAHERTSEAVERMLEAARTEGRLRSDASPLDLRLLFAATRAARQVEPEHWPRMLALMIDALDSRPRDAGTSGATRSGSSAAAVAAPRAPLPGA